MFRPLRHAAHGNRAKSAKKSKSRGEIGPFSPHFLPADHCLPTTANQPFGETPGQNDASSLAASSPLLERPKISPRFRFLGNFWPPRLRRRPGGTSGPVRVRGEHLGQRPRATRCGQPYRPNGFPARCSGFAANVPLRTCLRYAGFHFHFQWAWASSLRVLFA